MSRSITRRQRAALEAAAAAPGGLTRNRAGWDGHGFHTVHSLTERGLLEQLAGKVKTAIITADGRRAIAGRRVPA